MNMFLTEYQYFHLSNFLLPKCDVHEIFYLFVPYEPVVTIFILKSLIPGRFFFVRRVINWQLHALLNIVTLCRTLQDLFSLITAFSNINAPPKNSFQMIDLLC